MEKRTLVQNATATWAADSTQIVQLEAVGCLTRIDFVVELTPSATLTGANQPDGLHRLIQNLRIQGSPHTYVNLPADDGCQAGTMLHYLNRIDGHGIGHPDGAIAAPTRTFTPVKFTLHFGSRPRLPWGGDNKYDLTAYIPAGGESRLNAEWVVSGNDVMDDTVTITSAVGRFRLHRVSGSEAEIRMEMNNQGVTQVQPPGVNNGMQPAWSSSQFATAGTTADFGAEADNLIAGSGFLRRVTILSQDATASRTLRAGDEVTSIQLWDRKGTKALWQSTVEPITCSLPGGDNLEADDAAIDFAQAAPLGIYPIDLREIVYQDVMSQIPLAVLQTYGMDLRGKGTDDFQLRYIITTRAAGDDRLLLHEITQPIPVLTMPMSKYSAG